MATESHPPVPPWYRHEIGPRLKPRMRALLEGYSRIPPAEVEGHIYAIRTTAYTLAPYPCIGQFSFLSARTPSHPAYQSLLTRLRDGASMLDIGTCLGQSLRFFAGDGAPTGRMVGVDVVRGFWELGFELWRDGGSLRARFVVADVLDEEGFVGGVLEAFGGDDGAFGMDRAEEGVGKGDREGDREGERVENGTGEGEVEKGIDIILVNHVLHLFDWETQVRAGRNIARVSRPGTWVVGCQIGCVKGMEKVGTVSGGEAGAGVGGMAGGQVRVDGTAGDQEKGDGPTRFFHDSDSWRELWRRIGIETGTEWTVEGKLVDLVGEWDMEPEDVVWMGPDARGLEFTVCRVR